MLQKWKTPISVLGLVYETNSVLMNLRGTAMKPTTETTYSRYQNISLLLQLLFFLCPNFFQDSASLGHKFQAGFVQGYFLEHSLVFIVHPYRMRFHLLHLQMEYMSWNIK
jgi:hypothetical protein